MMQRDDRELDGEFQKALVARVGPDRSRRALALYAAERLAVRLARFRSTQFESIGEARVRAAELGASPFERRLVALFAE